VVVALQNFRIDLGYDGTAFWGSQRQNGVRTVQADLEAVLEHVTGEPTAAIFAGRTDRGVHAVGQVANARLMWGRDSEALARALMALTPEDIGIYRVRRVDERFHARYAAREREYRYRLWNGSRPSVLLRRYVWHVRRPLEVEAMREAAGSLVGEHDFASFAGAGTGQPASGVNCVRSMRAAAVEIETATLEPLGPETRLVEIRVTANAFLPHMVRNIVGSLVAIGLGERDRNLIADLLRARDRRLAPAPAPPTGLALWRVTYDDDDQGEEQKDAGMAWASTADEE
jgi:tRNA pseudouridine38-40 synthase